jgi:hypothetical protein
VSKAERKAEKKANKKAAAEFGQCSLPASAGVVLLVNGMQPSVSNTTLDEDDVRHLLKKPQFAKRI